MPYEYAKIVNFRKYKFGQFFFIKLPSKHEVFFFFREKLISNVWVHWLRNDANIWTILKICLYYVASSISEHWTQAKSFILLVRFVYC